MSNPELGEIVASVQAAVSRAYALGRLDALKHVITAMEAEELGGAGVKPLALSGPMQGEASSLAPAAAHKPLAADEANIPSNEDMAANDDQAKQPAAEQARVPWYMRAAN